MEPETTIQQVWRTILALAAWCMIMPVIAALLGVGMIVDAIEKRA